jgi:hypothetical protein
MFCNQQVAGSSPIASLNIINEFLFDLYDVKPGQHKIHDESPQVNEGPLSRYKEAITTLIKRL